MVESYPSSAGCRWVFAVAPIRTRSSVRFRSSAGGSRASVRTRPSSPTRPTSRLTRSVTDGTRCRHCSSRRAGLCQPPVAPATGHRTALPSSPYTTVRCARTASTIAARASCPSRTRTSGTCPCARGRGNPTTDRREVARGGKLLQRSAGPRRSRIPADGRFLRRPAVTVVSRVEAPARIAGNRMRGDGDPPCACTVVNLLPPRSAGSRLTRSVPSAMTWCSGARISCPDDHRRSSPSTQEPTADLAVGDLVVAGDRDRVKALPLGLEDEAPRRERPVAPVSSCGCESPQQAHGSRRAGGPRGARSIAYCAGDNSCTRSPTDKPRRIVIRRSI